MKESNGERDSIPNCSTAGIMVDAINTIEYGSVRNKIPKSERNRTKPEGIQHIFTFPELKCSLLPLSESARPRYTGKCKYMLYSLGLCTIALRFGNLVPNRTIFYGIDCINHNPCGWAIRNRITFPVWFFHRVSTSPRNRKWDIFPQRPLECPLINQLVSQWVVCLIS
jgi:hypothetical protein